jgi:RimJ/RimL family protein N-acetyltransferase
MRFANEFGACEITTLPGSPQVAVSHAVFIFPEHRGKGHGAKNHNLRLKRLKQMGYNYVICTVANANEAEKHILKTNGWNELASFDSSQTIHKVHLYGREL